MFEENQVGLKSLYGSTIERMQARSFELMASTIDDLVVPTVLLKIGQLERVTSDEIEQRLLLYYTKECPVLLVSVMFPEQKKWLASNFYNWIPMHSLKQRRLMETIANTEWWHYVIFRGNIPSSSMMLQFGDDVQSRYRTILERVNRFPVNEQANIKKALDELIATAGAMMFATEGNHERRIYPN